jgi:UDP-N-acetylmuramoylalanine--D-glutamate ligase
MSPSSLGRTDSWDGVRAVVLGFGPAGFAAADNLLHLGASVVALSADEPTPDQAEKAELLEVLGAHVLLGAPVTLPDDLDLLVVSPEELDSPLVDAARSLGVPVWGEVDLAWRLRDPATPWLLLAGARDTAPAARMLEAILVAGGLRTVVAGAPGLPLVEAVMDPEPYAALVVGLTPLQLSTAGSMSALAAAVLSVGSLSLASLARAYEQVQVACVYNLADPATEALVRDADVVEGARAIGITLGMPSVGMLGVVEDLLADRAFVAERETSAAELCTLADLTPPDADVPEPRRVEDALAAAALARAYGVDQVAVRDGLRGLRG